MTKRKAPEDNRQGQGGGVAPRVLTDLEIEQIEKLAAYLSVEQVADFIGVGRTTFYEIMERQPEVSVRYKAGRAKVVGVIAQSLISKARDGDTASMVFYLKTQAGWKEKSEVEVTGAIGITIFDNEQDL